MNLAQHTAFLGTGAVLRAPGMIALACILSLFLTPPTSAQSARVQFIHASPYPEARTVDVYIDGVLEIDDLSYRSATPFLDLPSGRLLKIEVTRGEAPNKSSPLLATVFHLSSYAGFGSSFSGMASDGRDQPTRFYPDERPPQSRGRQTTHETYLMILAGDPLSRGDQSGIDLFGRSIAQETSFTPPFAETIFFVATPGPTKVNISMQGTGGDQTLISDLGFGDFSARQSIPPLVAYDVDITTSDDSLIHSFVQDYTDLAGRLVINVVSGFEMQDNFTVLPDGATVVNPTSSAFVQFINNAPDSATDSVDIYVNDKIRIDNLAFLEATSFIEFPAGLRDETAPLLRIDVTRAGDADNSDPLYSEDTKYMFGQMYVSVLAERLDRRTGEPPLELFTHSQGRRTATVEGFVDILLFNGSADVPAIAVAVESMLDLPLVEHLGFGEFEPYLPLLPVDMTLVVANADNRKHITLFDAKLASMGLRDSAMVVLTSDFLGSGDQQTQGGRHIGLVAALPSGGKLVSFEASIPSPWWKSLWFMAVALVGLVVLVFAGAQIRIQRLRARERELSTLVAERTKDLEAERRRTGEQAQRLVELGEAKNRFFANISHEFRTPLTLILGPMQDLLDGIHGKISRQAEEQIHVGRRSAHRLLHLINQLLDLSKVDAGRLEMHLSEVDLIAHLKTLVYSFEPAAERKQITLQFRHDADTLNFGSDPDMLEKVFGNLLSNAIKFTPDGGKVWVTVNLPDGDQASNVEVTVKDTGPGISKEDVARVFDRFASFDPDTAEAGARPRTIEGIGIGLALAKELVELHGGVILVESEPGLGCTFLVRLPLRPVPFKVSDPAAEDESINKTSVVLEDTAFEHSSAVVTEDPQNSSHQERPTILVVEDNVDLLAYLRAHLDVDYTILEAADGQEGLETARKNVPDLVLTDVMMPVMDGYALCRALKADKRLRNIPVVMLTAKAGEEDTLEGLGGGADDYIAKPFSPPELKARIANLISARGQMRRQFSREVVVKGADLVISSDDAVFLQTISDIIDAHLGESNFGADRLADEVGMSRRNLTRRVEAVAGAAPAELIRRLRLERASQLLAAHAGTVAEVAYSVGFKSPSHFSAAYRKAFGISPKEQAERTDELPSA